MTILLLTLAAVSALALLVLAGLQIADRARPRGALAHRTRNSVLVHRVGLPSVRGVLVEHGTDGLVLRRAEYLLEPEQRGEPAPAPVPLDGDTLVPWGTIDCVQDLQLTAALAPRPAAAAGGAVSAIGERFAAAPADPRPRRAA